MNRLSSFPGTPTVPPLMVDRPSMERLVVQLLEQSDDDTICPSDVARAAAQEEWRITMPAVRTAACRLAARGVIQIVNPGATLPFDGNWRGPIRLARGIAWEESHSSRAYGYRD